VGSRSPPSVALTRDGGSNGLGWAECTRAQTISIEWAGLGWAGLTQSRLQFSQSWVGSVFFSRLGGLSWDMTQIRSRCPPRFHISTPVDEDYSNQKNLTQVVMNNCIADGSALQEFRIGKWLQNSTPASEAIQEEFSQERNVARDRQLGIQRGTRQLQVCNTCLPKRMWLCKTATVLVSWIRKPLHQSYLIKKSILWHHHPRELVGHPAIVNCS
jgi:hypothetical protein